MAFKSDLGLVLSEMAEPEILDTFLMILFSWGCICLEVEVIFSLAGDFSLPDTFHFCARSYLHTLSQTQHPQCQICIYSLSFPFK